MNLKGTIGRRVTAAALLAQWVAASLGAAGAVVCVRGDDGAAWLAIGEGCCADEAGEGAGPFALRCEEAGEREAEGCVDTPVMLRAVKGASPSNDLAGAYGVFVSDEVVRSSGVPRRYCGTGDACSRGVLPQLTGVVLRR